MTGEPSRDGNDPIEARVAELEVRVEKLSMRLVYTWAFLVGVPLLLMLLGSL